MNRRAMTVVAFAALGVMAAGGLEARSHRSRKSSGGSFDYYMLVLSDAPDYCAQSSSDQDPAECGAGKHVGFVVHGLWPQGETSRGPENCGSGGAVPDDILNEMLAYYPTKSLIQHEWKTHGTCTGLSATDYFGLVKKARDSVKIPDSLMPTAQEGLKPADVEKDMAGANPTYPQTAFRTSCYAKNEELKEIRVCLTKDLSARACGRSAGECTAPQVHLLPLR